jgi:tRNA A37 threonylcarbamoyladenosine synthetase subunit TsaC/SUA5/YrdC
LRCPDHEVALGLLEVSGPLAVTSANITGQATALDDHEARALFGDAVAVYLEGEARGGRASTIIDLTEESPLVLREGPVPG